MDQIVDAICGWFAALNPYELIVEIVEGCFDTRKHTFEVSRLIFCSRRETVLTPLSHLEVGTK